MSKKTLQIFRTGKHTPMKGGPVSFGEAELRASAKAYNPALHEAPITIGHPKDNLPAFGWIKGLAFAEESGSLEAEQDQLEPAFEEAVKAGRYKKMSASFYSPDSPANPVPGVYYLRHVAFLGAMPPAVKGLRAVQFSETEDGVLEFGELESWDVRSLARTLRGLRDWISGKFTLEEADKALPSYLVENLEAAAARPDQVPDAGTAPSFSEPLPPKPQTKEDSVTLTPEEIAAATAKTEALDKREADLKAKEDGLAQKEADLKGKAETAEKAVHSEFAEGLAKSGKIAPSDKPAIVELLAIAGKGAPIEFGEGEKKTTTPAQDVLKRLLTDRKPMVEFGEKVKGDASSVDVQDAVSIRKSAVEFQEMEAKAGRTVDIVEAVSHVMAAAKGAE